MFKEKVGNRYFQSFCKGELNLRETSSKLKEISCINFVGWIETQQSGIFDFDTNFISLSCCKQCKIV